MKERMVKYQGKSRRLSGFALVLTGSERSVQILGRLLELIFEQLGFAKSGNRAKPHLAKPQLTRFGSVFSIYNYSLLTVEYQLGQNPQVCELTPRWC